MKQSYLALIFLILGVCTAYSQISVDKYSLPKKGDVLKTRVATTPDVNVGEKGGPHVWDFSNVAKGLPKEVELVDPSEGSVGISDAEFLINEQGLAERYFKFVDEDLYEYHLKTKDPIFQQYEISSNYVENKIYRRGNVIYGNNNYYISNFGWPVAWDEIPDSITNQMPLKFDSLRISSVEDAQTKVDAYGKLILPDAQWDVLREKVKVIRQVGVAGYFNGTWITIDNNILKQVLSEYAQFFEPDTSYYFNYYSDKTIEVVASVVSKSEEGSNPLSIEYKDGAMPTHVDSYDDFEKPVISVYPNPTFGNVEFSFDHVPAGVYSIYVYNLLGRKEWSTTILKSDELRMFKRDLSELPRGTYLYSIFDSKGRKLTTKRIVIMTP